MVVFLLLREVGKGMNTKQLRLVALVVVMACILVICIVAAVAGSLSNGATTQSVIPTATVATPILPSPTPTPVIPTPTPTPVIPTPTPTSDIVPVPTSVVTGVTPDGSGLYYGDNSSSEETHTFYIVAPWVIVWKCSDTTGSMMFSVDTDQGNIIKLYGPYSRATSPQKIDVGYSGLLRIGAVPLDMDGSYFYGAAED